MSENTMTTAQGFFKEAYATQIKELYPDNTKILRRIPFIEAQSQPGGTFKQPVVVKNEHGITLAGANAGAFALNPPIAMSSVFAELTPTQVLMRTAVDYETVMRSKSKNAFVAATSEIVKNALNSTYKYLEILSMWGRSGLATLSAVPSATTMTITLAQWAPAIWIGSEGRTLRVESAAGVLRGTCVISSVDVDTRIITVDAVPAGTIATDILYLNNGGSTNEMIGMYGMLSNTGTLFGINAATYSQWKSSSYNVAGAFSFNKLISALALGVNKGLDEDVEVYLNPKTYSNVNNDQAALRRHDYSYKTDKFQNGAENLEFYYQGGKITIISTPYMKEGYAFIVPAVSKTFKKVGATDVTFKMPGSISNDPNSESYLITMPNNAGVEFRIYSNWALFSSDMYKSVLCTGIVNA